MIRLLYLSQATLGITDEQVQDILQSSQRNNLVHGITGVLVYGGGLFMQLLEGPETNVMRAYVRLIDDNRHGNCKIIHVSPANERVFQNWSMGIIRSDPLEFQHLGELQAHRLEAVNARAFTDTMRTFVQQLNSSVNLG